MKIVEGDLLSRAIQGEFDVIIHGCNCYCTMGSGIAKQIANTFPIAQQIDKLTIKGDINKLGTISIAYDDRYKLYIINAYTQFGYDPSKKPLNYNALEACFKQIKTLFRNKRIAYPDIGCGLAGGDWNRVSTIIENVFKDDVDHTYVKYLK